MANETYGNQVFLGEVKVAGKLTAEKSLAVGVGIVSNITSENGVFKITTPFSELQCDEFGMWSIGGEHILTSLGDITPESIGAISVSGGNITGVLVANQLISQLVEIEVSTINKLTVSNINHFIGITNDTINIDGILTVNGAMPYTTANKPTPADIGAISSDDPIVQNLKSKGQIDCGYISITSSVNNATTVLPGLYLYNSDTAAEFIRNSTNASGFDWYLTHNKTKNKIMSLSGTGELNVNVILENGSRVYSENNPPPKSTDVVLIDGSTPMTGTLSTPTVDSPVISLGGNNRIYSSTKSSCTNTSTDITVRSNFGIGFLNPNQNCFVPKNENAFLFDVKNAIGTSRGSWNAPVINSTDKIQLSGKTIFEKSANGWLSINPSMDYEHGLYFNDSILFTNAGFYVGDNGSAIKATSDGILSAKTRITTKQIHLSPIDASSWGTDGKSSISVLDNNDLQWLLSIDTNGVISTGIQGNKNAIRIYTNNKKNFTEFSNGNVYISGDQDVVNKNSLVSFGYLESVIKNVPTIVDGSIKNKNSVGSITLGDTFVSIGVPSNTLTIDSTGPTYNNNKLLHSGNTNSLVWKGLNQSSHSMKSYDHGVYTLYYTHITNPELDFSDVVVWDGNNKNGMSGNKSYIKDGSLHWNQSFVLTEIRKLL